MNKAEKNLYNYVNEKLGKEDGTTYYAISKDDYEALKEERDSQQRVAIKVMEENEKLKEDVSFYRTVDHALTTTVNEDADGYMDFEKGRALLTQILSAWQPIKNELEKYLR